MTLAEPADALGTLLRTRGVERTREDVAAAFAEEAAYYRPRSLEGRDEASLARLRRDCARVFLAALAADLSPEEFAPAFVAALEYRLVPGAREALARLQARGLALAVVANWDISLGERLASLGIGPLLSATVTSAEAEAAKPDPQIFLCALDRLGVSPERALHVGDEGADEQGAAAAGMRFAPAPLASAFADWA